MSEWKTRGGSRATVRGVEPRPLRMFGGVDGIPDRVVKWEPKHGRCIGVYTIPLGYPRVPSGAKLADFDLLRLDWGGKDADTTKSV